MAHVEFTQNIQRHLSCPPQDVPGETVREVLDSVFREHESARGYVLDDRGALRRHMIIFVNGQAIKDRVTLTDFVPPDAQIHIIQALSGG